MSRALLLICATLAAATSRGDENPAPAPPAPRDLARELLGREVYLRACVACHGDHGDGKGPGARRLDPLPRDFTLGVYKFRSTASGSLPLLDDVVRTISAGVPGTSMPSWANLLSEDERRAVADYVLGFSPRYHEEPLSERIVPPLAALRPLPATGARLAHGKALYKAAGCIECHGPLGRGDGRAAKGLKDETGRPIRPLDFSRGFYKGGSTPGDVYRTFITGLDGTPMPSFASALPDEEDRWSLVHYVRSLSRPRGIWSWLFGLQTPWE